MLHSRPRMELQTKIFNPEKLWKLITTVGNILDQDSAICKIFNLEMMHHSEIMGLNCSQGSLNSSNNIPEIFFYRQTWTDWWPYISQPFVISTQPSFVFRFTFLCFNFLSVMLGFIIYRIKYSFYWPLDTGNRYKTTQTLKATYFYI